MNSLRTCLKLFLKACMMVLIIGAFFAVTGRGNPQPLYASKAQEPPAIPDLGIQPRVN